MIDDTVLHGRTRLRGHSSGSLDAPVAERLRSTAFSMDQSLAHNLFRTFFHEPHLMCSHFVASPAAASAAALYHGCSATCTAEAAFGWCHT